MAKFLFTISLLLFSVLAINAQAPPIGPGVSHELAKWRAARYSDVRYKLNLTLEKMSPVLKGTMEIRVNVKGSPPYEGGVDAALGGRGGSLLVLDWRRIKGSEHLSTISNVTVNGKAVVLGNQAENHPVGAREPQPAKTAGREPQTPTPLLRKEGSFGFEERDEHLIFRDGVVAGENVIKLDFTSPILASGSAITRYIDKEDGSEYIYSLFVPSDASTAFPVFDQPDLKARFGLTLEAPENWIAISNAAIKEKVGTVKDDNFDPVKGWSGKDVHIYHFEETKPISTYVFAFAAGPWARSEPPASAGGQKVGENSTNWPPANAGGSDTVNTAIYVRKSQAAKFEPHAAEVFRLNRECINYLETYFDRKFPWPKYDLVLIPEFPFGGMEHAGATFLRESAIIFPSEPTKGDQISRANLIFHEAAHQWFGDLATMRWFDDLWLKEGFAEFMAYKTLEKVMPDANAWKVFYERNKQAAYLTDSTKGTTPIYQPIANLNSAKSAYGNIVYRKAPSFLKQAEFYIGPDKFQTAVRAFLKKYEFGNAGWEDLVGEFEHAANVRLGDWGARWIKQRGVPLILVKRQQTRGGRLTGYEVVQLDPLAESKGWPVKFNLMFRYASGRTENGSFLFNTFLENDRRYDTHSVTSARTDVFTGGASEKADLLFPNQGDYGYGVFLLDDKSREYVLKNIQNEKDPFLRSMMWGALWDSVREAGLDPREYVELAIRNLPTEKDETIVASILGRVGTALNYYLSEPPALVGGQKVGQSSRNWPPAHAGGSDMRGLLEEVLIERMQKAETLGQRITFYRAFLNNASSEKARTALKDILSGKLPLERINCSGGRCDGNRPAPPAPRATPARSSDQPYRGGGVSVPLYVLKTKDRFDIVTRLALLGDPDAAKLLADLEKTETTDDAKRYAYAARAAFGTAENKAKFWNDFVNNKDISESWIEAAVGPFNSIRHAPLTQPYLERALTELPNLKRTRKIFFINNWLAAWIGGQRDEAALAIVNKFLADNPNLDRDLRLKVLENVDLIERAIKIRAKYR